MTLKPPERARVQRMALGYQQHGRGGAVLGIGGVRVSPSEKAMLDEISKALGVAE